MANTQRPGNALFIPHQKPAERRVFGEFGGQTLKHDHERPLDNGDNDNDYHKNDGGLNYKVPDA